MAFATLTHAEARSIIACRAIVPDGVRKAAKKAAIAAIKQRLNISQDIKLVLKVDPSDTPYLGVFQAGTGWRIGADGRPVNPRPVATPAPTPTALGRAVDSPFASPASAPVGQLFKIAKSELLDILRDDGAGDTVVAPPAGLPAVGDDNYVVDFRNGDVYFRA